MTKRFTVYDRMEWPTYKFKEFPKLMYHPKGKERQIAAGEEQMTFSGPKLRNQRFAMIHQKVNNKTEEEALRKQGWHLKPSEAIAAREEEEPAPQRKLA